MSFYHVSRVKLSDDVTELIPDYYNRIATHGLKQEYFDQFWKEMLFEKTRRKYNPDKVSRFGCVFLVDSIESAKEYKQTFDYAQNGTIYEVKPREGALINKFDLKLLNCNGSTDQQIENQARMYFSEYRSSNVFWEYLHYGPVEISGIVSG